MNKILIASLAQRVNLGMMTIEQVPPIFREAVQAWIDSKMQQAKLENEESKYTIG